jgi:hypothetical protein
MKRLGLAILSILFVPIVGALVTIFIVIGAPLVGILGLPILKINDEYVRMSYLQNLGVSLFCTVLVAICGPLATIGLSLASPFWCFFADNLQLKIGSRTYRL